MVGTGISAAPGNYRTTTWAGKPTSGDALRERGTPGVRTPISSTIIHNSQKSRSNPSTHWWPNGHTCTVFIQRDSVTTGVNLEDLAAKLLSHFSRVRLCATLCDPVDGSPAGSAVPGILMHSEIRQPQSYLLWVYLHKCERTKLKVGDWAVAVGGVGGGAGMWLQKDRREAAPAAGCQGLDCHGHTLAHMR